jgi:tRNA modification GTPase
MSSPRDTIFALSSGRPPAAIAVVRISGPRAGVALKALSGKIPEPRKAALARIRGADGDIIDEALALWFPAPHSETGEDVAELQLHGGRAVIAGVLAALGKIEGLRPAEAGEFTRRAFENGKLDLTAVEGLADLIAAETQAQRRQAFRQLKGLLGERAETWRGRLIEALALVEARIDFSDEADVPENLLKPALATAQKLHDEIGIALANAGRGERLREGLVVAIAGPPNAGKSTLLNRLARREAAIVSPFAGTTRDVIEVHLDLDGYPVTLVDTAGIRETGDPVEREGVARARERAASADLVLWVIDASTPAAQVAADGDKQTVWIVRNKIDLPPEKGLASNKNEYPQKSESLFSKNESEFKSVDKYFAISATKGTGLEGLLTALSQHAENYLGGEPALITRERHRRALQNTHAALARALGEQTEQREEILAEELRTAATELGRLTGRVDVEDILDVIFRDFCIGK